MINGVYRPASDITVFGWEQSQDGASCSPPRWVNSAHCSHSVGPAHRIKLGLFVSGLQCQESSALCASVSHTSASPAAVSICRDTQCSRISEGSQVSDSASSKLSWLLTPNTPTYPSLFKADCPSCSRLFQNALSACHDITFSPMNHQTGLILTFLDINYQLQIFSGDDVFATYKLLPELFLIDHAKLKITENMEYLDWRTLYQQFIIYRTIKKVASYRLQAAHCHLYR